MATSLSELPRRPRASCGVSFPAQPATAVTSGVATFSEELGEEAHAAGAAASSGGTDSGHHDTVTVPVGRASIVLRMVPQLEGGSAQGAGGGGETVVVHVTHPRSQWTPRSRVVPVLRACIEYLSPCTDDHGGGGHVCHEPVVDEPVATLGWLWHVGAECDTLEHAAVGAVLERLVNSPKLLESLPVRECLRLFVSVHGTVREGRLMRSSVQAAWPSQLMQPGVRNGCGVMVAVVTVRNCQPADRVKSAAAHPAIQRAGEDVSVPG